MAYTQKLSLTGLANLNKFKIYQAGFSMSAPAREIIVEEHNRARVITLNRPKALNALNLPMVREIYPKLKEWNTSDNVDLIVVKSNIEKAFCAGGDVLAVVRSYKSALQGGDCTIYKDFFREEYTMNHLIGTLQKPYVSLINGIVLGGGCGLSVNGKFRVATEKTMLAMPETALGLFPDVGGSYFLSRLKGNLGMYLALTGHRLLGADTLHAGLATHYVETKDLPALEKKLLSLENASEKTVDSTIREFEPKNIPEFTLAPHLEDIATIFKAIDVEQIVESLEKHNTEWSKKTLATLSKMSPTSLKITHKQLLEGAKLSYSKIFNMEYRLTQRCLADHDFHEGCRAILVDKDRNPKWQPSTLQDVKQSTVDAYFKPLADEEELEL